MRPLSRTLEIDATEDHRHCVAAGAGNSRGACRTGSARSGGRASEATRLSSWPTRTAAPSDHRGPRRLRHLRGPGGSLRGLAHRIRPRGGRAPVTWLSAAGRRPPVLAEADIFEEERRRTNSAAVRRRRRSFPTSRPEGGGSRRPRGSRDRHVRRPQAHRAGPRSAGVHGAPLPR